MPRFPFFPFSGYQVIGPTDPTRRITIHTSRVVIMHSRVSETARFKRESDPRVPVPCDQSWTTNHHMKS